MKAFVLVPMEDGIVRDVQAFPTRDTAAAAERAWLIAQGIDTNKAREHRSDWGTGIAIWECEIQNGQSQTLQTYGRHLQCGMCPFIFSGQQRGGR